MPKRLSRRKIAEFLGGRHVAVLGTIGDDGAPVLTPIWYLFDGGTILMRTDAAGAKARNIERDPRVSVCVQDERAPYKSVTAYGTATVEPARKDLAERMPRHYLGFIGNIGYQRAGAQAVQRGREEVTLVVSPTRYATQDFTPETPLVGRTWLFVKRILPPWL
jgi:PPOX class probable F420-dependent enzyme